MKKDLKNSAKVEIESINTSLNDNSGDLTILIENTVDEWSINTNLVPLRVNHSEIIQERKIIDNTIGLEGELIISKDHDTIISIDVNGNLIISDLYADCFSINAQGELIFER